MDIRPDLPRLSILCLLGFKLGETVLFCPDCKWQAFEHQGMRPVCPDCGANLHYAKVDPELVELADPMNRLVRAEDAAFKQVVDEAFAARPKSFQETLDQIENGWPTHPEPLPVDPKALEAALALTDDYPAWVKCGECDSFLCTIHGGHADSCACPELEFWDSELGLNPYEQGGRLTVAELEALKIQHGYTEE